MKFRFPPILLIIIVLSWNTSLRAQIFNSTCSNTPLMASIYRNDAYAMSITRLQETGSTWKDSVDVPVIFRDSIARALYALYNMDPSPLKDTLMNLFGFSTFNSFSPSYEADSLHGIIPQKLKEITITVANTANWAGSWASGNFSSTPNDSINYLVLTHQISCVQIFPGFYTDRKIYRLKTTHPVNTPALKNKFLAVSGVTNSELQFFIGDGNTIKASFNANGILLHLRNGCGDCPAGCTWGTIWDIQVFTNTDCHLQLINRSTFCFGCPPSGPTVCFRTGIVSLPDLTLTGTTANQTNYLNWEVQPSKKVNFFLIEKSTDGLQFHQEAVLSATTGTTPANIYHWKELVPTGNIFFYRIKAVYFTQGSAYSNSIRLKSNRINEELLIYPNPVTHQTFSLPSNNWTGTIKIKLFSLQGKLVWEKIISAGQNNSIIRIPASLQNGIYRIQIENNGKNRNGKIWING